MNFLQKQRYIREIHPELLDYMSADRVWSTLWNLLQFGLGRNYNTTPGVILGNFPIGN